MLPVPPHFEPGRVGEVWRVPYEERVADAGAWAREHALPPAAEDRFRLALLLVDVQNTFCTPGFELFVPGAVDDNRRVCDFVYRNLDTITRFGRRANVTLFVANGPSMAGLGLGGQGYLSYSVATPTGEGITTPLTFTRYRRIMMTGSLRMI